ncbi:hypothetical protein FI667_g7520, partial [Globisporangium splendens]
MQDPIRMHSTMSPTFQATSQLKQQQHVVVLKVRPGGNNNNNNSIATRTSQPWTATHDGIAIGTLSSAAFHCNNDPMVSPEHGTLECTTKHGVWVYVDHSVHGTRLNDARRVHQDAVVVHNGDRLLVGNTEIELQFEKTAPSSAMKDRDEDSLSPLRHRTNIDRHHHQTTDNNSVCRSNQSVVAPSPIMWPASTGKLPDQRLEPPTIVTSGDRFYPSAAPPEYIASPIPGSNWRRKRHSMTAFTPSPAPPPGSAMSGGGSAQNQFNPFLRPRPLVPSAPSTPPRQVVTRPSAAVNVMSPHQPYGHLKWTPRPEDNNEEEKKWRTDVTAAPPPLDYSPSPVTTPTSCMQRAQQPQNPSPPQSHQQYSPHTHMDTPPSAPKSRRDDLRIQVSKKMAGAIDSSKRAGNHGEGLAGRPTSIGLKIPLPTTPPPSTASSRPGSNNNNNNSEFDFHNNPQPSSPVAHKDILRQNESLLNILKNKYKEEQLLKQQQEEWMRHNFNLGSAARTPPMSPIKKGMPRDAANNRTDGNDDAEGVMSDLEIPLRAPALLRTISLGLHQASPRLTAAVLASRARVGSFDGSKRHSNQRSPQTATNISQGSDDFSSVSSSASTEPTCHRRVTRSLSISSQEEDSGGDDGVSSAELNEFMGYEDDVDGITSFTTHALYASNEYKSSASKGDDSMLQFSSHSSSTASSSRTATTTNDRFSIDIVTSPEDDDDGDDADVLKSPTRGSGIAPQFVRKAAAGATPNLFDGTLAKRLHHRNPDKSPIDLSPGGSHVTPARRFHRIQSP